MRLSLICNDTRGGVQPYLALGLGLRRAGHDAWIVAPRGYCDFVEKAGMPFFGIEGDTEEAMRSPEVLAAIEKGFLAIHKLMIEKGGQMIKEQMSDALTACEGSDVIVGGFGGMPVGEAVAERLGVPFIQAHLQPLTTTSEFPGILSLPGLSGLGLINRLSHAVSRQVFWQAARLGLNAARKEVLGLPAASVWGNVGKVRHPGDLILYGYSPSLLPRPSDWPAEAHVTGYWFLDKPLAWSPPEALETFIKGGSPSLAVGFGSMAASNAEATAKLVLEAVERAGRRVVLLSGWGGLSSADLPSWAFLTEAVPHDWLYPRCGMAIHHGGAGTTGAALRAGIPSVIVPFGADQPFWARLIAGQNLGARVGSRKRLTAESLAKAIQTVQANPKIQKQAEAIGNRIRAEDGVGTAVELLETQQRRR